MAVANLTQDVLPWYRQGWPWFIISIPAASVILGFNLLFLAHQTNNSLVVDDYYKAGKAINQFAVRDRLAAQWGLHAGVTSDSNGIVLQLSALSAKADNGDAELKFDYPAAVSLRWVHVTQAHKDGSALLAYAGGGRYVSDTLRLPQTDQWRLHVEPATVNAAVPAVQSAASEQTVTWRLVSDRVMLQDNPVVTFGTRQP
jgi:hypothetical protein